MRGFGAFLLMAVVATALPASRMAGAQETSAPELPARLRAVVPPAPTPTSFVADPAGVIPASDRALIDERIGRLQAEGYGDVAVAIIRSLEGYQPYEVGVAIYRTWGVGRIDTIGSARRNLGALLLIVPKELAPDNRGHCWITTGTGSERLLTDATAGRICRDEVIPHLVTQDYTAAVLAGVAAIGDRLRADAELAAEPLRARADDPADGGGSRAPWFALLGVGAVAAVLGTRYWRRHRPRKCPACRQPMHRVDEQADDAALASGQRLEEHLGSVDYDVWQCDCGEQMIVPHRAIFTRYRECPACRVRAVKTKRVTVTHASYTMPGLAVETRKCEACGDVRTRDIVLPVLQKSNAGGSSGSSHAGVGGGGGRGFGGSGRTAGGGGGGSY